MFEVIGREDGERDGTADARDNLSKHPRPDLKLSLLSSGYQNSYFAAYHGAYGIQKRVERQLQYQDLLIEQRVKQRAELLKRNRQQIRENSQGDRSREN